MTSTEPSSTDAVVYQNVFYYWWQDVMEVTEAQGLLLRAHLELQLQSAFQHMHTWLNRELDVNDRPRLPMYSVDRRKRVTIHPLKGEPSGFLNEHTRRGGYFCSFITSGTLVVQLGFGLKGLTSGPEVAKKLSASMWKPDIISPLYIGQTICFGGAVSEPKEDGSLLAQKALPTLGSTLPIRDVALPRFGGWLFDRTGLPDTLAFFYPSHSEVLAAALLQDALPELLLLKHKVSHQYLTLYERHLRRRLTEMEGMLMKALAEANPPAHDLIHLEKQLQFAADAYRAFAEEKSRFERARAAVNINAASFRGALAKNSFPIEGPVLQWTSLVDDATTQMEADENFYQASSAQAEISLKVLQTQAEVIRGQQQELRRRDENRTLFALTIFGTLLTLWHVIESEDAASLYRALAGLVLPPGMWEHPSHGLIFVTRILAGLFASGVVAVVWILIVWRFSRRRIRLQKT